MNRKVITYFSQTDGIKTIKTEVSDTAIIYYIKKLYCNRICYRFVILSEHLKNDQIYVNCDSGGSKNITIEFKI